MTAGPLPSSTSAASARTARIVARATYRPPDHRHCRRCLRRSRRFSHRRCLPHRRRRCSRRCCHLLPAHLPVCRRPCLQYALRRRQDRRCYRPLSIAPVLRVPHGMSPRLLATPAQLAPTAPSLATQVARLVRAANSLHRAVRWCATGARSVHLPTPKARPPASRAPAPASRTRPHSLSARTPTPTACAPAEHGSRRGLVAAGEAARVALTAPLARAPTRCRSRCRASGPRLTSCRGRRMSRGPTAPHASGAVRSASTAVLEAMARGT